MGYKRDILRLDVVERGNRAMGATRLTTTRSPNRNGSTFAGYTTSIDTQSFSGSPVSFVLEHKNAHSLNMPDAVSFTFVSLCILRAASLPRQRSRIRGQRGTAVNRKKIGCLMKYL